MDLSFDDSDSSSDFIQKHRGGLTVLFLYEALEIHSAWTSEYVSMHVIVLFVQLQLQQAERGGGKKKISMTLTGFVLQL